MPSLLVALMSMASGECRWILRHDIHVYCFAPAGREPRYGVVCPDAGLDHRPTEEWVPATEAAALIGSIE